MAVGLYLTPDGKVMVDYGARRLIITAAQYQANGYRPPLKKLTPSAKPTSTSETFAAKRIPTPDR
jgi:hypothetical protein